MTTTLAFITLPTELYYTQADQWHTVYVGTRAECIAHLNAIDASIDYDAASDEFLSRDWNHLYPLVRNGQLVRDVMVGFDEPGFVVEPDGMYVIPESEAVAAGYDAENQSW